MRFLISLILVLFAFNPKTFGVEKSRNSNACEGPLKVYPQYSYERFAEMQRKKAASMGALLPEFTNPAYEIEAQKTWSGAETPKLFEKILPEGVTFVGHSLRKSDPGFVKSAGTGDAVILRVSMPYKGRTYSTNVAVPVSSLLDNLNRTDKWLVGPEAEACIDWGHGGGTKDTGEHTAFGPINYFLKYGISVIGQAQPWHSEGDRNFTNTSEEYLTELRQEFIRRFVHPDVPTFGVGHSLGGLFADMQWRRLGKKSVYKGFVSLSGVPDTCPGCTPEEREKADIAMSEYQKLKEVQKRLAPGDRTLGDDLLKNLKISPLSSYFTQLMHLDHKWTTVLPKEERVPLLSIWGEGDFLYVGSEDVIRQLRDLENVEVVTYSPRVDFNGSIVNVGHLIFDHWRTLTDSKFAEEILRNYLKLAAGVALEDVKKVFKQNILKPYVHPDTFLSKDNNSADALVMSGYYYDPSFKAYVDELAKVFVAKNPKKLTKKDFFHQFVVKENPETFTLVREMIEKTLNKKIGGRTFYSDTVKDNSLFRNLALRYANDLVAREVYNHLEILDVEKKTIPGVGGVGAERTPIERLNERKDALDKAISALGTIEKLKNGKVPLSAEEVEKRTKAVLDEARIALKAPAGKRDGIEWTVQALSEQRKAIYAILAKQYTFDGARAAEVKRNVEERETLKTKTTKLNTEKKKLSLEVKALSKDLAAKEKRFAALLEQSADHKNGGHLQPIYDLHVQMEAKLDELKRADQEVRIQTALYQQKLFFDNALSVENHLNQPKVLTDAFNEYAKLTNEYHTLKVKSVAQVKSLAGLGQLGPELKQLYAEVWGEEGLIDRIEEMHNLLLKMDIELENYRLQSEALLEEYITKMVSGLFQVRIYTGRSILTSEYDQNTYKTIITATERIQAVTKNILKDMPPAGPTELY